MSTEPLVVQAAQGVPEVGAGDDLAAILVGCWGTESLRDGDVVVVTSKVVSKAEGRVARGDRGDAVAAETDRVVARRGDTAIVRTRHGLVMAAAGIDASNTAPGTLVLLPQDPDGSARRLRNELRRRTSANVAVVVSDTSGRAWRVGQTDIAIGAAGLVVIDDHAGREDGYGNALAVTAPAVADELAGAAELATGKLSGSPAALVRGATRFVLPVGEDGPGASALVRPEGEDMFGLGARESVLAAVTGTSPDARRGFGGAAPADVLANALRQVSPGTVEVTADRDGVRLSWRGLDAYAVGGLHARVAAVCLAHGWLAGPPHGAAADGLLSCRRL